MSIAVLVFKLLGMIVVQIDEVREVGGSKMQQFVYSFVFVWFEENDLI